MVLRALVPALGVIAIAVVVHGVHAQESRLRTREAPASFSFTVGQPGSYLGVYIREVTAADAKRLGLDEERGALVSDVPEDGPAAEAGLATDDVIVSWNGSRVESAAQLRRVVSETPAGRSARVGYVRAGRERTADVKLEDNAPDVARWMPRLDGDALGRLEEGLGATRYHLDELRNGEGLTFARTFMGGGRLGVSIQSLGDQLAEYFGAAEGGALVVSVGEDSPAARAGLKAGDVIVAVAGESVEGPNELARKISRADEGEVEIGVLRDRKARTLKATLPAGEGPGPDFSGNTFFFAPGAPRGVPGGGIVTAPEPPRPATAPRSPAVRT
jgi:predicted metalloprotease with PDZ domain